MLTLELESQEFYNEELGSFLGTPAVTIVLEHSLVSVSKWESMHEKPFLSNKEKTVDEVNSYILCMVISPEGFSEEDLARFTNDHYEAINQYINKKMTATWFSDKGKNTSREVVTSELIYYWMIALDIPFECQYWHLNRLLTLIKVCNLKNQPKKKTSAAEIARRNSELNAQRRAAYGTSG